MLITARKFAELLGVSGRTVERWRRTSYGPPAIRIGFGPSARYRYDLEAVRTWIRERGGGPESEPTIDPDELVDIPYLSRRSGWAEATIRTRHCRGLPMPTVTKVGRLVRYRRRDIEDFLERHAVLHTAANSAASQPAGGPAPIGAGDAGRGATVG